MNTKETLLILRKVQAHRPAQKLDIDSGGLGLEAWEESLADIRFADAVQAVAEIVRESGDWIDPAMIRLRVRRIRAGRLERHPEVIPPPDLTARQELAWLRDARRRIADGEQIPDDSRGQLRPRNIRRALTGGTP